MSMFKPGIFSQEVSGAVRIKFFISALQEPPNKNSAHRATLKSPPTNIPPPEELASRVKAIS